jgi:hypothetical protein
MSGKKKTGDDYEPSSLIGFQSSMSRYLKQHRYAYNIKYDPRFTGHRKVLKTRCKYLRQLGKGLKPNRSQPFTAQEIEVMYEKGVMGSGRLAETDAHETIMFFNR